MQQPSQRGRKRVAAEVAAAHSKRKGMLASEARQQQSDWITSIVPQQQRGSEGQKRRD